MKKFFISAVLATAMVFSANAQFWVGGSVGFESNRANNADGDRIGSESVFTIAPEFGFSLDDRLSFGLGLNFKTEGFRVGDSDRESASAFGIAPFAQYAILQQGRFILLCRATVGFEMQSGFTPGGNVGSENWRHVGFGANITPFVHYVVSDRFNVFAGLNFLSLNLVHASTSYDGTDLGSVTMFNLGADANNLFNTGNFQVGFIFKF